MNALKPTLSGLLLAGVLFTSPGCDEGQDVGMVGGRVYPPIDSLVYVQFRRDYLGQAGQQATAPMGEGSAVPLASSGELRRITEEFVVLAVAEEPNRELWIPRDSVLLLDVRRPVQPQPE